MNNIIDMIKLTKLKGILNVGVFYDKLLVSTHDNDILHMIDIESDKQYGGTYSSTDGFILDNRIYYTMKGMYDEYIQYEYTEPINIYNNIQDDERFYSFLDLKSSDPSIHYSIDGLYLPMFYGILPVNKGDTVALNIMNYKGYNTIIRYDVYKNKANKVLHIYMNILNI